MENLVAELRDLREKRGHEYILYINDLILNKNNEPVINNWPNSSFYGYQVEIPEWFSFNELVKLINSKIIDLPIDWLINMNEDDVELQVSYDDLEVVATLKEVGTKTLEVGYLLTDL